MAKAKEEKKEKVSPAEFEKRVKELGKSGLTAEKIGQKLKEEGIHSKDYSKDISKILGEDYVNPDLKNVSDKLDRIKVHLEKNKQDKRAKREKDRIFSKLRRIKKYLGVN